MAYTPPEGDNVILNLTGFYTPPDGDNIVLDLQSNPFVTDNLEVEWYTDLWDSAPTEVYLLKPRFRATFIDLSGASGVAADGVEIIVTSSDLTVWWSSGNMNFADMEAAGHPILPPGVHYLLPDEVCTVKYNINETADVDHRYLLRDGSSYSITFQFHIGIFDATIATTVFIMAEETIAAINPETTITYTDISNLPIVATWATDPINVRPIIPWFRSTYYSSFATSGAPDEYLATHVFVEVRDADLNLIWQSGYLSFQEYEIADNPILPYHNWNMRSGEICEIPFQFDDNKEHLPIPPAMLRIPRDGAGYIWRMRFYCDGEGVYSEWTPDSTFNMFNELWTATSLLCEGAVNPVDVTDITPDFDTSFFCDYTEFHVPSIIYYRLQVSGVSNFLSDIRWDTGFVEEIPPVFPDLIGDCHLDTITYAGIALRRNGEILYWRIKLQIDAEWGNIEVDWFTVQNWTFLNELWSISDIKTNGIITPIIKDYYPEYTAQFNNNYPEARATHVQFQVCPYVQDTVLGYVRCYRFDGTDEVNIGDVAALNIVTDLTIEFWIRPTATTLRTDIVDKCYGGEYAITYETDGRITYYHGSSGGLTLPYISRSWQMGMTLNNWYHVAITRNNTTQEIKCYIAPYAYGSFHTELISIGSDWETPVASALAARIGRGSNNNTYQGDICQVRFWNVVRTVNQLDNWAYLETPNNLTGLVGYYKLNEVSGNAIDSSISENIGTVIGTIERRTDGPNFNLGNFYSDWTSIKWDSGWVSVGSLPPGSTVPPVYYPSPYESADDGFYWDNSRFGIRTKMTIESDGTYYTDWEESYFDLGEATIDALLPRVDGFYGVLRVRTFVPAFDAQYETDAYDLITAGTDKAREYAVYAHIQISTLETNFSSPVWDIGWVELNPHILDSLPIGSGPYSNMIRIGDSPDPSTTSPLTYDTYYYWKIRFKNERNIISNWSEVMQFRCAGYVNSEVSDTDIINAFYLDEEYEVYVESKSATIFYTLINITTGVVLVNSYLLNKGIQPRLIFDGKETSPTYGRIVMLFLGNGKIYERNWMITNYTPEVAPSAAPQLIDGALNTTCTLPNLVDIEDVAQRPFIPGSPYIYTGCICNETGNLYPGKIYVVEFAIPANHLYFYDEKTYKIYVQNGIYEGSYSDQTEGALKGVAVGALGYVPATDIGCDVSNVQRTRLKPWLPDSSEYIETIPRRAWLVPNTAMIVGFDTWGLNQQCLMGAVQSTYYKYIISQIWIYKKVCYPDEDLWGVYESLMGNVSDNSTYKYIISQIWIYKKVCYPDEDSWGLTECLMGATYETHLPREWVSGDYYYGQYWYVYNYYSANIR
jgi:hypothetical protein